MGNSSSRYTKNPASFATSFLPQSSSVVPDSESSTWKSYDYIIVGGGTAGCILASRLSEDPQVSVLLVEAGESHEGNLYSRIPLAFLRLLKTPADWNYQTTPQRTLDGRVVSWPRGRILGGTSSINAMIYHRADPRDFDSWERKGIKGWGYGVLKEYARSRDTLQFAAEGRTFHSDILIGAAFQGASSAAVAAAVNLGLPLNNDLCPNIRDREFEDAESTAGAGAFPAMIDASQQRSSAATAYLTHEVLKRRNLTVAVAVFTERVLFTTEADGTARAVGIQVSSGPSAAKFAAAAKREVIVCGGVVASPHILQLSGIGPASVLQQHQVPVVCELPHVGRNLADHYSGGSLVLRARPNTTLDKYTQNPLMGTAALLQWMFTGKGVMTQLGAQVAIFTRLTTRGAPDLEILVFPVAVTKHGNSVPPLGNNGISVVLLTRRQPALGIDSAQASSKGSVELRSNSVYDPPVVDPKSVSACLLLDVRTLASRPDDANWFWPGDADPDAISDDEIRRFVRERGQSAWHPLCSARMGVDATDSVVDAALRVHGVRGLRVCDGSVFPDQRAADLIRGARV
ncbi:GMC oxidoreductase [Epithele typhae]|uniref:GMC oxidoreductase n=1 Tax=Epithele typhae TaxID=378194 RepID=UPI002008E5E4|nr:GMC oxidoreductase [Epithele typhae]KAH9920204.1 GMC oxidoreductase [Epithele typhae]